MKMPPLPLEHGAYTVIIVGAILAIALAPHPSVLQVIPAFAWFLGYVGVSWMERGNHFWAGCALFLAGFPLAIEGFGHLIPMSLLALVCIVILGTYYAVHSPTARFLTGMGGLPGLVVPVGLLGGMDPVLAFAFWGLLALAYIPVAFAVQANRACLVGSAVSAGVLTVVASQWGGCPISPLVSIILLSPLGYAFFLPLKPKIIGFCELSRSIVLLGIFWATK